MPTNDLRSRLETISLAIFFYTLPSFENYYFPKLLLAQQYIKAITWNFLTHIISTCVELSFTWEYHVFLYVGKQFLLFPTFGTTRKILNFEDGMGIYILNLFLSLKTPWKSISILKYSNFTPHWWKQQEMILSHIFIQYWENNIGIQ